MCSLVICSDGDRDFKRKFSTCKQQEKNLESVIKKTERKFAWLAGTRYLSF